MSRTKRYPGHRIDLHETPAWCVRRLLEAVRLPGGRWLEPCVGGGAIVRAVAMVRDDVRWDTVDIRRDTDADLVADFVDLASADALDEMQHWRGWDVCLTNPPFSRAMDFVREARRRCHVTAMLFRLGWLSSARRQPYLSHHMPDVYVIPDRPSFDGIGSDSADYAWMVWDYHGPSSRGRIEVLATTPRDERRAG